jgi:type III secretion protein L
VDKKSWSKVLKAGTTASLQKWRVGAPGTAPVGGAKPGVPRMAVSPELAAAARLEAERAALASQRTRLEEAAAFLETCAKCLTGAREAVLEGVERDLVDLVLKVAAQVIHDEVTQRPELITFQVESALVRTKEDSMITVRLHPLMLETVREVAPRLLEPLGSTVRLHFEPDPSIAPGGCIVETSQQIVDARIGNQISRIGAALKQSIKEGS